MANYVLKVNGQSHPVEAEPEMPLLWVLRDLLQLTGTKYGCGMGICGACTVHENGRAVRSCQVTVRNRCRQELHHHRRSLGSRRSSLPARLDRGRRLAVRILPGRHGHDHRGAAGRKAESHRRRNRFRPVATRLPLWDLPANSQSGASRGDREQAVMNTTRRAFLQIYARVPDSSLRSTYRAFATACQSCRLLAQRLHPDQPRRYRFAFGSRAPRWVRAYAPRCR